MEEVISSHKKKAIVQLCMVRTVLFNSGSFYGLPAYEIGADSSCCGLMLLPAMKTNLLSHPW